MIDNSRLVLYNNEIAVSYTHLDKDAITTASEIISGQDFYQTSYGVVFDSMVELFNEGKPVDLVTLQERLKEKDVPPEISSLEFVRDLVNAVPTSANVKDVYKRQR